jgi:HSP20 family molecular chaperone IbpA
MVFQSRLPDVADVLERTSKSSKSEREELAFFPESQPLVEITEDTRDFQIQIDLSEFNKEKLKVVLENGALIISGKRNFVGEEELMKFCRVTMVFRTLRGDVHGLIIPKGRR